MSTKRRTVIEDGAPPRGASPTPRKSHRDRVFDQACALAREDEKFRRDLLAVLKTSGKGQRGQRAPAGEHAHILAAFEAAKRILADSGKRPTKTAAIDMLVAGPFSGRSREALEKLPCITSQKKHRTK